MDVDVDEIAFHSYIYKNTAFGHKTVFLCITTNMYLSNINICTFEGKQKYFENKVVELRNILIFYIFLFIHPTLTPPPPPNICFSRIYLKFGIILWFMAQWQWFTDIFEFGTDFVIDTILVDIFDYNID